MSNVMNKKANLTGYDHFQRERLDTYFGRVSASTRTMLVRWLASNRPAVLGWAPITVQAVVTILRAAGPTTFRKEGSSVGLNFAGLDYNQFKACVEAFDRVYFEHPEDREDRAAAEDVVLAKQPITLPMIELDSIVVAPAPEEAAEVAVAAATVAEPAVAVVDQVVVEAAPVVDVAAKEEKIKSLLARLVREPKTDAQAVAVVIVNHLVERPFEISKEEKIKFLLARLVRKPEAVATIEQVDAKAVAACVAPAAKVDDQKTQQLLERLVRREQPAAAKPVKGKGAAKSTLPAGLFNQADEHCHIPHQWLR